MKKLATMLAISLLTLMGSNEAFAYEVRAGDTMSEIAKAHSMTLQELGALNTQVADLNLIFVGQEINTQGAQETITEIVSKVSAEDRDLLARLVRAEAQGEPFEGKVAVAAVVLNRVDSESFPNTIREVIYQRGQFSPVYNGSINRPADEASKQAVEAALTYERRIAGESLYFYNVRTASSRWLDGKPTTAVIGNHTFK